MPNCFLRVCIVTASYPPARCGVGDYTALLSTALASNGTHISVVTSGHQGTVCRDGNPTVLPVVHNWSLLNVARVIRAILKCKPDIVHFQFPTNGYFDVLVPILGVLPKGPKVVVTMHEPLSVKPSRLPWVFRPIRNWLSIASADAIIVVAQSYAEFLHGVSERMRRIPCELVPIASNIPVSQLSTEAVREVRRQLGIPRGTLVLTYFGFVHARKGFDQVLDLIKILEQRKVAAVILVLGELLGRDPYQKDLLDRISNDPVLRSAVKVLGYLDSDAIADHLAVSDACVLPFVDGVHPKRGSFLAALDQGIFIVTTSDPPKGYIADENVYYAKQGDIDAMALAVQRHAAPRRSAASHPVRTWEAVAQEHLRLFKRLLQ